MTNINRRYRARESTSLSPFCPCIFLWAFNGIGTTYRAYVNGNYSLVAFIFFIYSAFLSLEYCFSLYQQLPPHKKSIKRDLLKYAIWLLFTAIMLGIAYQFAPFFGLPSGLFLYAISTASSATIFYFYIIYDDQNGCTKRCPSDGKRKFSQYSCHVEEAGDMKFKHYDSVLEEV